MKKKLIFAISAAALAVVACVTAVLLVVLKKETYSVTLNANGGAFSDGKTTITLEIEEGENISEAETPVREGYNFLYWTLNETEYDETKPIESDLILYAAYEDVRSLHTVTFESEKYEEDDGEFVNGVVFVSDVKSGDKFKAGAVVTFQAKPNAFYAGTPIVQANGRTLTADDDGNYSVTITSDTKITASGVHRESPALSGTGTMDNPFQISRPVDLLYMAEKVNEGDTTYSLGYYCLVNDIDVMGCELDIIGDNSPIGGNANNPAYFGGCFNGQGYTISNFTISSDDKNYVGLFGQVAVYPGVESSGLIYDLHLKNCEITATVSEFSSDAQLTLACGALIGYSLGANVYLCSVEGGYIDVYADSMYFSYAGGLIGYQQSLYSSGDYISSVVYSHADVEVNANAGMVLYAGGISGYLATNYALDPAFILNSYSTGSVSGATRTGGIAGGIAQYCSVSNCYSTADVSAYSGYTTSDNPLFVEYCTASAGSLVGFADNDSALSHSFATGRVSAYAELGANYAVTGEVIGNGYEANYTNADSRKYVAFNCYYAAGGESGNIKLTEPNYLKTNLGWKDIDWIFTYEDGQKYPTTNFEPSETQSVIELTIQYVNGEVEGETQTTISLTDDYFTFADLYYEGIIAQYLNADSGKRSYGYFFDVELKNRVPYGYIVGRDVTLYAPFVDYSEVSGTYYLMHETAKNAVKIELSDDGSYEYQDGGFFSKGNYVYNGENVVFEDARFAKLYERDFTRNGIAITDLYGNAMSTLDTFSYYLFKATENTDGNYEITDGIFFVEDSPLLMLKNYGFAGEYYSNDSSYEFYVNNTGKKGSTAFTYVYNAQTGELKISYGTATETGNYNVQTGALTLNSTPLSSYDIFKGTWETAVAFGKSYTFDGLGDSGTWTSGNASGSYSVDGATINLGDGVTAELIESVLVFNNGQKYYPSSSLVGEWRDLVNDATITLEGIINTADGESYGKATLSYFEADGTSTDYLLKYAVESGAITLYYNNDMFGTLSYDGRTKLMTALLYSSDTGAYVAFTYRYLDKYLGEWITNAPAFDLFDFNGLGEYGVNGGTQLSENGVLSITDGDGVATKVEYILDGAGEYEGSFVYKNQTYSFKYDENGNKVTVFDGSNSIVFEQKDVLYGYDFVDVSGKISYKFDGKGNLDEGGKATIGGVEYSYKIDAATNVATLKTAQGEVYGTIALSLGVANNNYTLVLNDGASTEIDLYIDTLFTGEWAVSGAFGLLEIGPMNLNGVMEGSYLGEELTFSYESKEYVTYVDPDAKVARYVFAIKGNDGNYVLAICEGAILTMDNYVIASKKDVMYGEWKSEPTPDPDRPIISYYSVYKFDGVSGNAFSYGTIEFRTYMIDSDGKHKGSQPTTYNYRMENSEFIIWSESVGNFVLDFSAATPEYTNGDDGFSLIQVDNFYKLTAKDSNDVTYVFDGMNVGTNAGTVTASNGKTYKYTFGSQASQTVYSFTFTEVGTNKRYTATLDTSVNGAYTITLQEQTA